MSPIGRKMTFSVCGRLAPVVVVADEHELLADGPGLELVRPRARRVLGGVRAGRREDALVVLGSRVGLELRQRRRADDVNAGQGQRREDRRRRPGEVQRHGRLVDRLTALVQAVLGADAAFGRILETATESELPVVRRPLALERSGEVEPALEVEADGVGVERLAVVERHVLAEVERPRKPVVARRPVGRERGDHL